MKVTEWVSLKKVFPTKLKVELKKRVGSEFDGKLYSFLLEVFRAIDALSREIQMTVDVIVAKAHEKGLTVTAEGKCCGRACGTCLGKYPFHYPYFRVKGKPLSTRRLYEFLLRIGLTEEDVQTFDRAVWARHYLISVYHGLVQTLGYMGLTELKLEYPIPAEAEVVKTHES